MGKDQELLEAARNGNTAVVEKILSQRAKRSGPLASLRRGPGANVQDGSGYSALHHAALHGHRDIVQLLLSHEASTNILDAKGSSPLHLAAWAGNVDVVRMLLCHGPSVPNVNLATKDNETALHCAAQYGHTEVVALLLEHSCDPSVHNVRGESALDLAAQYGRLETVELLVRTHPELIDPYERYYDLPDVFSFKHTPLHLASRNGHKAVVDVLLAAGTTVNVLTKNGTALHEAALCGKLDVVKTLLDAGIELNARDARRNTVLDLLSQFPKHATQEIYKAIKQYAMRDENDYDGHLPPIPVPNLGSPYENVRLSAQQTAHAQHWTNRDNLHLSKSVGEGGYLSDGRYSHHDGDQISISSMASSTSSISPRADYVIMGSIPSPTSTGSKVSPRPPKKPPRRNLSVSPTHVTPSSPGPYEYMFLARSGDDSMSVSSGGSSKLRRGRSADQYEVMKYRQSYITPIELDSPVTQRRKSDHQPVALTYICDDIQVRTTNPRRKLRRNFQDRDQVYENHDPPQTFVSRAYITLKSSAESLLEDRRPIKGRNGVCPLSPTNYKQPPTPDHPPPSALQAEISIHERIRPLSQEYKRRSRDIETETEEELLVYSVSMDLSSGSFSSSVSLSDKSVSTDNHVEEFFADAPFAGLLKGSTSQLAEMGHRVVAAERPKTLRKLRNVYENVAVDRSEDADGALSILSPFDEQEEWNKISEIMATFNSGLLKEGVLVEEVEVEIQARLGMTPQKSLEELPSSSPTTIGAWLASLGLPQYESTLADHGFDDLDFLNGILGATELHDIDVTDEDHKNTLLAAIASLPLRAAEIAATTFTSVEDWLCAIKLGIYKDTFRRHLYVSLEKVARVWEVELTAVLEIGKVGHRRRILSSLLRPGTEPPDLSQLKSNLQPSKDEDTKLVVPSGTGTLRHSHKKNRPAPQPPTSVNGKAAPDLTIRQPSELLVGVPATLTAQWRHRPEDLVTGNITYVANYLGSTVVKELRGTESTKKSIQKLKKSTSKELTSTPDIVLAISYRGVKFLTAAAREPVCEHEIRNIHCACQDADDLTHFAYITKDHVSRSHYCHVFCVNSMDQATEVILTLGQAFEVAYQMALRDQLASGRGHTRSQSANQIVSPAGPGHARSLSVNEMKVNGTEEVKTKVNGTEEVKTPSGKAPLALNDDF